MDVSVTTSPGCLYHLSLLIAVGDHYMLCTKLGHLYSRCCVSLSLGFDVSRDGKQIKCKICTAHDPGQRETWMKRTSQKAHLESSGHKRACAAQSAQEDASLERFHMAAVLNHAGAIALNNVDLRSASCADNDSQPASVPTAAEAEMWASYEQNGADFSVEEFTHNQSAREQERLEQEIETAGILNPARFAAQTGFRAGDPDTPDSVNLNAQADNEEDEILADILGEVACEGQLQPPNHWGLSC